MTKLLSELESKETYREKLGLLMDTLDEGGLRYCSKPAAGIDNTRFMVDGGPWDTTLTDAIFKERFEAAMEGVKQGMNRARYAELYGAVIKEWLENEGADLSNDKNTDGEGSTANDRPDKLKQRNILEGYMWRGEGVKSDLAKFKELLEETFGDPKDEEVDIIMAEAEDAAIGQIEGDEYEDIIATFEGRETTQEKRLLAEKKITQKRKMAAFLQLVRKNMKEYCKTIFHKTITTRDVSSAIDACLSYDSLTPSQQVAGKQTNHLKLGTLWIMRTDITSAREIRQSSTLLEEIASVMTLTLRDLGHWEWPGEGVNLYMRRHLNGKHRCFFEQDVITIIFLQYIGVSFGAKLKSELINVVFNGWDWGVPLLSKGEVNPYIGL